MTVSRRAVLGMAVVGSAAAAMARAEEAANTTAYVVIYFEVGGSATREAAALLRQIATAGRRAAGNLFYDALEEVGRPSRLALVEGWRDKEAHEAYRRALAASGLEAKMPALLVSPPDIRPNSALSVASPAAAATPAALYVLTHADIVPPAKAQAMPLLEQLAREARTENGNLWFDVFYQDSRPNHFTLFEAWRSPQAFAAYRTNASTRAFRRNVLPMQGALYDERVYRALG